MSSSVKDRPSVDDDTGSGGRGSGDGGGGECSRRRENDRNQRTAHDRKSKRVSFFRFRSGRKQSNGRSNRPSPAITSGGSRGFGGGKLCICFKPTPTLDSPGESQTSDPNSSELKFEFLNGLIEKNDFWSKECNTHLDVQSISSSDGNSDEKL